MREIEEERKHPDALRGPIEARLWYRNFLKEYMEKKAKEGAPMGYAQADYERINKEIKALNKDISPKTEKKLRAYIGKIRKNVKK